MQHLVITLLLFLSAVSANASICTADNTTVEVLPFTFIEDYSKRFADLPGGGTEVGMVRAVFKAKVEGCNATIGWTGAVLYIASELQRNQCAFDHVKAHELEHVRIYEEGLAGMADRVKARVGTGETLIDALNHEADEIRALHRQHDSPAEYELNKTACSGRIMKLSLGR